MTVTHPSQKCHTVSHGVSHTTPTRPDPTRPLLKTRDETSHHGVGLGDARELDGMMTATRQGIAS